MIVNQIIKNQKRPDIKLYVLRVESSAWRDLGFHKHHYLTQDLPKSAKCFLFLWDDKPIGFVALLNQTHKGGNRYDHRISRIVVNPQYQGLGFSGDILKFMGGLIKSMDKEANLYIKTVHTKMGKHLKNSDDWQASTYNGKRHHATDANAKNRIGRVSYCFKYVGAPRYGYEYLLTPINELRRDKNVIETSLNV